MFETLETILNKSSWRCNSWKWIPTSLLRAFQ